MKKFLFGLLPFFVVAMCMCSLTACSSDDEMNESPIVGTWAEVFEYDNVIQTTTFVFNADGKGLRSIRLEEGGVGVNVDPTKFSYAYNEQTGSINLKFDGDSKLYSGNAVITGKTLMLTYGGTYFTLIKK